MQRVERSAKRESSGIESGRTAGLDRRGFLAAAAGLAASAAALGRGAEPRDYRPGAPPVRYPDPDVVVLDKRFARYKLGNAAIERLHTGTRWAEGPAWCAAGRYLVWSDIPDDRQLRWLEEDGHVSEFRRPANHSNGNTFDREGRLISCEHGARRVVRFEHDGSISVLADRWQGKRLNAPNDVAVGTDGSIWFTDPGYGSMVNYEGFKGELEVKEAVYRIDPKSGAMEVVTDEPEKPNGICFSPDGKKLYVVDTGAPRDIKVWDVADGKKLSGGRRFASMENVRLFELWRIEPVGQEPMNSGTSDGIRADVDGNIWASAGWGGPGYDGVHVFAPEGERIGAILLPEVCSNVCFGGTRRNRLFMTASTSLYALYVETRGAGNA